MDRWIDEGIGQMNLNILMINKYLPTVLGNSDQSYFYKYYMVIYTYIVLNVLPYFIRNGNASVSL